MGLLRRIPTAAAFAALLLTAVAAAAQDKPATPAAPAAPKPETVLAKVDGRSITLGDVLAMRDQLGPQAQMAPPEALMPQILEQLINRDLVAARARKDGLDKDPELKKQLAAFELRMLQQLWLLRKIETEVTPASLKAAYEARIKAAGALEEVKASHILVKGEAEAKEVITALAKGQGFAKLAAEKSVDPSAKTNAGDLGWFKRDQMVPAFADAAFAMKKGETSKEPVKSDFGWHVIRVEDRRTGAPPPFEELEEELRDEQASLVIRKLMADLRKDAKVETFGLDGKPLK